MTKLHPPSIHNISSSKSNLSKQTSQQTQNKDSSIDLHIQMVQNTIQQS